MVYHSFVSVRTGKDILITKKIAFPKYLLTLLKSLFSLKRWKPVPNDSNISGESEYPLNQQFCGFLGGPSLVQQEDFRARMNSKTDIKGRGNQTISLSCEV